MKDFYNDDEKKTYYYEMDEFFFSDEKYAKVNDYLQQMYENYRTQYEEEGENHTGAYELVDETLSEGQRYDDNYLVFNGITLADDEYVSLHFNDTVYYAGAAHPLSYYTRDDFHCHRRRSHPGRSFGEDLGRDPGSRLY